MNFSSVLSRVVSGVASAVVLGSLQCYFGVVVVVESRFFLFEVILMCSVGCLVSGWEIGAVSALHWGSQS